MVAGRDTGCVELPAGGSGAASAFPARCRAFSIALRRIGRKRTVLRSPAACAFYLFIRQPMGRKSALRREIPWILRGFQGRLSC